MVDYEAELYDTSDNNLLGIRVKVWSDTDDVIETLNITNKTDFDALEARIDTVEDTSVHVASGSSLEGETLDTILTNTGTLTEINASKLGGHTDTYYAPNVHSHTAGDINNLYQYEISLSNYNPRIGDRITVTVKVTNYNDNPVANKLITIKKDNIEWVKNVATNSNGEYTKYLNITTPGIITFSVQNAKAQCIVNDEWKQVNLLKNTPFQCELYVLESQKLANLVLYIPRYVGWCRTTNTSGMDPDEKDPASLPYISENKVAVSDSKRRYLLNGVNTEYVLPLEYCPARTISQPLYRGDYVTYLERDGSISTMAKEYTTNSNGKNWSVDVHFNQVWRYEDEEQ